MRGEAAAVVVVRIDGGDEPLHTAGEEIVRRDAAPGVTFGQMPDQAEVGEDHQLAGLEITGEAGSVQRAFLFGGERRAKVSWRWRSSAITRGVSADPGAELSAADAK